MSVHFISGKPGAGKSLLGLQYIFDELVYGDRHIVTNLGLLVGELNAYYQENYDKPFGLKRYRVPWFLVWLWWLLPDWLAFWVTPISLCELEERLRQPRLDDICSRITLITDDEMSVFFTKRPGIELEHVSNEEWRRGKRPDYSVVKDHGVYFCLDEVHIAFNARAWADTGAEVLYYLSQHRKLGDDVICITQSVANVDKQFRSVAQDFTYVRNLGKEKWGLFRLPLRFVRKTYAQPPVGETSKPMEMGMYSLDAKGLARCYDTAKGVGIHGRSGADKRERKRGLHWAWVAIGLPLVCFFVWRYFPSFLAHKIAPAVTPVALQRTNNFLNMPGQSVPGPSHGLDSVLLPPAADVRSNKLRLPVSSKPDVNEIFCVGWCLVDGDYIVFLSDGRQFDSKDHEIDWIKKREVSVLGDVYPITVRYPAALAPNEKQPNQISQAVELSALPQVETEISPVNQVQSTVIGQAWRDRQQQNSFFPRRLNNFSQGQVNRSIDQTQ